MIGPKRQALELLDQIAIPMTCQASWAQMRGDGRARYCEDCHEHVYDFSVLTTEEAAGLVREKGTELCARITRHPDGKVATRDRPLRWWRRMAMRWPRLAAMIAVLFATVSLPACREQGKLCPPTKKEPPSSAESPQNQP